MTQSNDGFSLLVPIGPGQVELRRFHDLLDSLFTWEPGPRLCVAIESETPARSVVPPRFRERGCRFITLDAPFQGRGEALQGRLCAGILLALRTIHREGPFEFVLRMDTDALVIGSFRDSVQRLLGLHPEAGLLGTLGCTCRREAWYFGIEKTSVSDVFPALKIAEASDAALARIRAHTRLALENGYVGKEYCQGGVYVLSFELLARLFAMGCLDRPEDWVPLAVPEDVMMGMYARTVGLRSVDGSLPGEPFGNHFQGLAYRPSKLLDRGHSLIHSVKGDLRYSEAEVRRYFQSRRQRAAPFAQTITIARA